MFQRILLSLLGALLLFIAVLLWNRHGLGAPCVRNMDRAYTHLSVQMAERCEAFEGAFSHAGFRHPGPALFYYLAATTQVLEIFLSRDDGFRIAILALNCLSVGLSIFLLSGLTPHRTYSLLLAPIAFIVISPRALFDYWNPYPIPAATAAYLLTLVYIAYGRLWYLPLATGLASFIAQCHLSTPPFLGLTALYAVGACVWRRRHTVERYHSVQKPVLVSIFVAAILWLGPLYDLAVYGFDSNLMVIARRFLEEHHTSTVRRSFGMVWELAAKKLSLFFHPLNSWRRLLPLLLLGVAVLTTPRRGAFFHVRMLVFLSWLITVWALSKSFNPLADYLVSYFLGVLIILLTVALMSLSDLTGSAFSRLSLFKEDSCRLAVSVLALGAVLFSAAYDPEVGLPQKKDPCAVSRVAEQFAQALDIQAGTLYSVTPATMELRSFSVQFALQMLRLGANICFDDQWEHYVGRALTCEYHNRFIPSERTVAVELSIIGGRPRRRFGVVAPQPAAAVPSRRLIRMDWIDTHGSPHSFEHVLTSSRESPQPND